MKKKLHLENVGEEQQRMQKKKGTFEEREAAFVKTKVNLKKVSDKESVLQKRGNHKKKTSGSVASKGGKHRKKFQISDIFTRKNITYFLLLVFDIILIIYVARKNKVNYVNVVGNNIFVGDTKNLLVGRNYITLVVTFFFYVYWLVMNHFFLQQKNTKKFVIGLFFFLLIFNMILFFSFTKRIF